MHISLLPLIALVATVYAKVTELDISKAFCLTYCPFLMTRQSIETVNKPSECSIQTQNGDKLSMVSLYVCRHAQV